jgi:hypothetical protein
MSPPTIVRWSLRATSTAEFGASARSKSAEGSFADHKPTSPPQSNDGIAVANSGGFNDDVHLASKSKTLRAKPQRF